LLIVVCPNDIINLISTDRSVTGIQSTGQQLSNDILRKAFQQLTSKINNTVDCDSVIDQLFAADVISSDQYGELNKDIDRVSKTRRLIGMIHASKHPAAFVILRQVLYKLKDYRSLAEEIDRQYYSLSIQPTVASNNTMSPRLNLPASGFETEDPANGTATGSSSTAETGSNADSMRILGVILDSNLNFSRNIFLACKSSLNHS
jgi:Caspase recruitment domain